MGVIIIDILVALAILVLVLALVGLIVSARLMLPFSEWLNAIFRRVGLAGPWRGRDRLQRGSDRHRRAETFTHG